MTGLLGAVGVVDIASGQHEAAFAALVGAVAWRQQSAGAGRETTAVVAVLLSPQRGWGLSPYARPASTQGRGARLSGHDRLRGSGDWRTGGPAW